nr:MucBP domain-containing protein [Lactobacillus iners]
MSESSTERVVSGTEKETYTTGKIDKEGFKFIETKDPKEDPTYSADGSSKTGNFKADKEQAITYVYEKEVEKPAPAPEPKKGSFKETHIYRVVDEDGKVISESTSERVISGTEKEEYTTGKVDKEGYTFKNTQDAKENPKYSEKGEPTKGKFVGDKTQAITYVYEKKVAKPAPTPEPKKGSFKETHIYRVVDEDGKVISESTSERVISGTEKEEYTTGKVDKEGYTFKNTQDAKENPKYSEKGEPTKGKFVGDKTQAITYVYEKKVAKPAPAPEPKKGSFKETHIYRVVDEDGKVISESSTERVVSGTEKEEYTTGKVDKEGYTFKNTQDAKENPKYSEKGEPTKGKFVGDKTQAITYVYEKKVAKPAPTPEPKKGSFKETHIYRVVDEDGKVISESSTERVVSGTEKEEYTTGKVDKEGYTFKNTQDAKENPKYSEKGEPTKGKFVGDKTQAITYVYEKKVAKPAPTPEPKKGSFKETHIYRVVDEDGKVISESTSERVVSGTEKEEYTTGKLDKEGYTFKNTQDAKENPKYSEKGEPTKGKFVGDKTQAITYVYEKKVAKPAPAPEPKKGSFKETHIYRVVDEDGKVISESTSERVVSGTEKKSTRQVR